MKKICGVMGGMGPLATVDFLNKIIQCTKAKKDADHLHTIIDCNTSIPDRSAYILYDRESPEAELIRTAKRLENAGADFIVLTCNTAHYFYDKIQKSVHVPVINMIDEVGKYAKSKGMCRVGLLATTGTAKAGLYKKYLSAYGIELVMPNEEEQNALMDFIYKEVKGHSQAEGYDLERVMPIIRHFQAQDVDAVILGCTELPIALNDNNTGMRCIDVTQVLVEKTITFAGYELA